MLKQQREQLNYTQARMARMMNVSITAWQRWEHGAMGMSDENVAKLADIWGFSENEIRKILQYTKTA